MRSYKAVVIFFLFSQLLGCGNQLVGFPETEPDSTAPTVISTAPASGETDVAINLSISATFSEEMDSASISGSTFTLYNGTTPVTGAVSYAGFAANFDPTDNLEGGTVYTATITAGAADPAGNNLAVDYVWSFTTGTSADTTPPTVISTVPADDATDVVINASLTATFSEQMNPATINDVTFTLVDDVAAPVDGAVSLVGATATFNPTADLEVDTLYTGTISIGATDLAGNALAADYEWSFTTGAAADVTPPEVILTSPLDEAIDVAINTNVAAVFSELMSSSTISTSTFTLYDGLTPIPGAVDLVGATAMFNPTADLDFDTEYKATITTGAEDLAGNPLAATYEWSFTTGSTADVTPPTVILTSPLNLAIDVAINTNVTAVFSELMDETTITFTLVDESDVSVGGSVSLVGNVATFNPTANLNFDTEYTATITTGAEDLAGNPLAAGPVPNPWTFTTGATADVTPPTVILTSPLDDAIDVAINTNVTAVFSEAMDPLTVTDLTFTLVDDMLVPVDGNVILVDNIATFDPTANLEFDTVYTAAVSNTATDLAGNPLVAGLVPNPWTFTTDIAPTVTLTIPEDDAIDVAVDTNVTAVFSEAMDPLTVTDLTFTVVDDMLAPVDGAVILVGNTATFDPTEDLEFDTTYTAMVTNVATDLTGNPLVAGLVSNPWTFTTDLGPDIIVDLGLAETYGIASTGGVTNTGATTVNGDVVLHPNFTCNWETVGSAGLIGDCAGSPPIVNGTVSSPLYPDAGILSAAVVADLRQTYIDLSPANLVGTPATITIPASTTLGAVTGSPLVELDNLFYPGVYKNTSGEMIITGDLTLDAQGDPNAVFVFQAWSALKMASRTAGIDTHILLINGADAANVWWQVGSAATFGTYSEFQGNALAYSDITMETGATSCGRLFAGASTDGAFVFDTNVVSVPGSCP